MIPIQSKLTSAYTPESPSEIERFEKAAKPLMDFLKENFHPHVSVIVTSSSAELVEGLIMHNKD